jgi:hypothetical protein
LLVCTSLQAFANDFLDDFSDIDALPNLLGLSLDLMLKKPAAADTVRTPPV